MRMKVSSAKCRQFCLGLDLFGRGPQATAKLFTPESGVDILENLIDRTLRLISQK